MKSKISKILQNILVSLLICSCITIPVNAKVDAQNLAAADYQTGVERFGDISEAEWINSATVAESITQSYMGEFVEVGNNSGATGLIQQMYDIQISFSALSDVRGIVQVGNRSDLNNSETNRHAVEEQKLLEDHTNVVANPVSDEIQKVDEDTISDNAVEVPSNDTEEVLPNTVEKKVLDNTSLPLSDDVQVFSAPTADIVPQIINMDSLRDGMITTETQIAWIFTGDATTYYYGGYQSDYNVVDASDGFVTQFYTPGTYSVLCYGENEEGETSEVIGYTVTVVSEFPCQTIEDNIISATDSKSYSVDIDFTGIDTAAVCIVRTGKSDIQFHVIDEAGNEMQSYATIYSIPKRWIYIAKPTPDAGICHYTITVTASTYSQESGAFRVIVGNKKDAEAMMGGLENVVDLDVFRDSQNNYIRSTYIPRQDEYWFITSMPFPTVFTLLSHDSHLRFKLKDIDTLEDLFDSNGSQWSAMHSTRFTGSYSYAEKAKFEALTGSRHYLVIYNNAKSEGAGVLEQVFQLGVGQPMYALKSQTAYGSSVTVNSTGFSSTVLSTTSSSYANTGVMNEAYLSGPSLFKLDRWRLSPPNSSNYKTSSVGSSYITYNFTPGGSLNTPVKGEWDLGIKLKSGNVSTSCDPSVKFSFYYEYGDDTITIVPAN